MSQYYPTTVMEIRIAIQRKYPVAQPDENGLASNDVPSYILWMINKIGEMDAFSYAGALKAARWLGWVLRVVESDLNLWDNTKSRELVRSDVLADRDKPAVP